MVYPLCQVLCFNFLCFFRKKITFLLSFLRIYRIISI
nr:MAG TPA: hypothetical protein [Caudoviricetes sp.]